MVSELTIDGDRLRVPAAATPAEAAAIAVAVRSHLAAQEVAVAQSEGEAGESWEGERFAFAGRLEAVSGEPGRIPLDAPTDRWTAAGRTDRY